MDPQEMINSEHAMSYIHGLIEDQESRDTRWGQDAVTQEQRLVRYLPILHVYNAILFFGMIHEFFVPRYGYLIERKM